MEEHESEIVKGRRNRNGPLKHFQMSYETKEYKAMAANERGEPLIKRNHR